MAKKPLVLYFQAKPLIGEECIGENAAGFVEKCFLPVVACGEMSETESAGV